MPIDIPQRKRTIKENNCVSEFFSVYISFNVKRIIPNKFVHHTIYLSISEPEREKMVFTKKKAGF